MNVSSQNRAPAHPLQETRVDVRIRDLVACFELEHHFRNGHEQPIEALLTFPMSPDAAFLSLQAEIDGKTLDARIIASQAAEERYDEAIAQGDTALMVRTPEPGILTVALGNLMPGEMAVVRIRFASRVPVAGSVAWFRLPTVIRPRYGAWRLHDFETPEHDFATEHPLSVAVDIQGLLHGAAISCPSHAIRFEAGTEATQINVPSAFLDRDVVLQFDLHQAPAPTLQVIRHGDALLASITGPVPEDQDGVGAMDLCLVLDCSGSMAGDAIMQSREAVRAIAARLSDNDRIQLLRFGSATHSAFRRLMPGTRQVRQALDELAGSLEANLGSTEMQEALTQALRSLDGQDDSRSKAIILITDGAVQPSDIELVRPALVKAGVRAFVVAVGSSAGVEVLQSLAHATGAVIERAMLGESIDQAADRMAGRARHKGPSAVQVKWPGSSPQVLPTAPIYPGDALELALVASAMPDGPVDVQVGKHQFRMDAKMQDQDEALRAILGQARYAAADEGERAAIALAHGLLTRETSAILVLARAENQKATSLPLMAKVPSMIPAGMAGRTGPRRMVGSTGGGAQLMHSVSSLAPMACAMDPSYLDSFMESRRPGDMYGKATFDLASVPALLQAILPAIGRLLLRVGAEPTTLRDLLDLLDPKLADEALRYFEYVGLELEEPGTLVGVMLEIFEGNAVLLTDEEELALSLARARYGDCRVSLPGASDF